MAQTAAELAQLSVERMEDEIQLSAELVFELPAVVEEALLKGIPVVFVMEADVLRERWYWSDKKIGGAQRYLRLAFQPLTRRWRLNVSTAAAAGVGLALNQSFDTLALALASIKRVGKWKIAQAGDLDPGGRYKVDFHFRLDLSQLPRPFQIGALGQSDWDLAVGQQTTLPAESSK